MSHTTDHTLPTDEDVFTKRLFEKYGVSSGDDLTGKQARHFRFASTSNARGRKILDLIDALFRPDWKRVTLLDVGCAYGGCAIEAGLRGARAVGIDVTRAWLELAEENLSSRAPRGSVRFYHVDATDAELLELLPADHFDFVIVNDVLEHVHDTAMLLRNIRHLASSRCRMYFAIPNRDYFAYVLDEPHQGGACLTQLDPFRWRAFEGSGTHIYYRPWEYYFALFAVFGLSDILIANVGEHQGLPADVGKEVMARFNAAVATLRARGVMDTVREAACHRLGREIQFDLRRTDTNELAMRYLTPFWRGFACLQTSSKQRRLSFLGCTPSDLRGRATPVKINASSLGKELSDGGLQWRPWPPGDGIQIQHEADSALRIETSVLPGEKVYISHGEERFPGPTFGDSRWEVEGGIVFQLAITWEILRGDPDLQFWLMEFEGRQKLYHTSRRMSSGQDTLAIKTLPRANSLRIAFRMTGNACIRLYELRALQLDAE